MSEFKPSQKSVQKVALKITTAAEIAGGEVVYHQFPGADTSTVGVFFSQEDWAKFIVLLLDDAFKP